MRVLPGGYELVADAIDAAGTEIHYLSGKHEIANYYMQAYPRNWQTRLGNELADLFGGKAESYKRNFRPDRINRKASPGFAEKLKTLGREKIPGERVKRRDLAGKRAHVKTIMWMKISKEKAFRKKDIDKMMTASQASRLRKGDLDAVIEAYGNINPKEIVELEIESFHLEYA